MLSWIKQLFSKKSDNNDASDTVYVGNLAYSVTKNHLETAFSNYGAIATSRIIRDRQTGRSKGYGFITFQKPEYAKKALKMNGEDLRGRQIRVSLAKEKMAAEEE